MARPKKATVDYFPHQTEQGKTLFILQQRWGNDGFATWFKILERLGKTNNHVIDCNERASVLHLAAYCLVSENILFEILDFLAEVDAINRDFWRQKFLYSENFVLGVTDAYRRRLNELPTIEKVSNLINVTLTGLLTAETPTDGINVVRSTEREREREREREIKEKTQTTDENRVEVLIRKSVEEKRQFIRDRFHFTDNEIEIEVEEIILKCQKRSPGPDVWLFISRWFKNRRDEINVREKSRTGEDGTRSHIGTNNVGNGTSGAFEEEFVDRSHLWNL